MLFALYQLANIHALLALHSNSLADVSREDLTVLALPYRLFVTNGGHHNVASGSLIRLHCIASSISAPHIAWFQGSRQLYNDPPHVRIRNRTDGNLTSSVLVIDSFGALDNGSYYCQANDGMSSSASPSTYLSGKLVMH